MVTQFKIGDRVRCVTTSSEGNTYGLVGDLATVIQDFTGGVSLKLRFDRGGVEKGVFAHRFELVEPKAPEAPKVVRKTLLIEAQPEGGFLVSEPDIYIHNEAKRLAAFSVLSEALEFMDKAMGH